MKARVQLQHAPEMIVCWLDDILYPANMYRRGACRVGADLIRMMLGIDVFDPLQAQYRAGCELAVVRDVVMARMPDCDMRILVKVAAAMEAHNPRVAAYEDALESLPLLQALGTKLALVGEGSRIGQRMLVEKLGLKGLFHHMVYADPQGAYSWQDALLMLEVVGGLSKDRAVILCADAEKVRVLAESGWFVVYVARHAVPFGVDCSKTSHDRVRLAANLYDLPEALGFFSSEDKEPGSVL